MSVPEPIPNPNQILSSNRHFSSLHGVLFLSVAISTSERQCSRDAAFFLAEEGSNRSMFKGLGSYSVALSLVPSSDCTLMAVIRSTNLIHLNQTPKLQPQVSNRNRNPYVRVDVRDGSFFGGEAAGVRGQMSGGGQLSGH